MLLPDDMIETVVDTVSGIKALDYVIGISQFHRIQASPGLMDSLEYVKAEIEKISSVKTKIHVYDVKGEGSIGKWENLFGWSVESGTLELLEPEKKTLADYSSEPISLAVFSSNSQVEAEVVYVGKGLLPEDYEGKNVKGKIVLTTSRASLAHKVACIANGAAGVLTFVPPSGKDEIANLRRYEGLWPEQGEKDEVRFGFALTQADGVKMRDWLLEGKTVKVKANVKAELGQGKQGALSALLEGKDKSKEIWLVAHICHPHPGANDNASGSAAILETLRTINHMITSGKIEQPDYSIRFIWMPEWNGMIEYIHNEMETLSRCKFVINADMVGANPCLSGSIMNMFRTPHSLPSTLNNVISHWLCVESDRKHDPSKGGSLAPFKWQYQPYSAGSDHYMFTDSTVSIPAIMLNQFPDKFYHTSTDTVDKIDVGQMARAARVVTLSALTLAHPRFVCKERLLAIVRNEAAELMQKVTIDGTTTLGRCLENPEKAYPRILRWLGLAKNLGVRTLDQAEEEWYLIEEQKEIKDALKTSLEMNYTTEMVVARKAYLGACAEVGLEAKDESQFDLEAFEKNTQVKRNLKYALPPSSLGNLDPERFVKYVQLFEKQPHLGSWIDELLNLSVDWTRLEDIWDRLCFQFGKFDLTMLEGIVSDLKDLGVLEVREE
ncbi:MAG: DUF4910 domain-containing protein [Candidatus Thorarchaeota archaeon]|nr:DUF4910 domain-containing protein [Candidatus Thorarchaeota archaeon]